MTYQPAATGCSKLQRLSSVVCDAKTNENRSGRRGWQNSNRADLKILLFVPLQPILTCGKCLQCFRCLQFSKQNIFSNCHGKS